MNSKISDSIKSSRAFSFAFSAIPKPDTIGDEGSFNPQHPDVQSAVNMIMSIPPLLHFSFNTDDDLPPSVLQIHKFLFTGYKATSNSPQVNEIYGIALDAMRIIQEKKMPFGKITKALLEEAINSMPEEMKEVLNPILVAKKENESSELSTKNLKADDVQWNSIFVVNEHIVAVSLHPIRIFNLSQSFT